MKVQDTKDYLTKKTNAVIEKSKKESIEASKKA